jgi:DNA polymerase I-like protein with 3'-5' exonuclease and polymerase domains
LTTLIFDLESDGLLDTVTKIHCLVIKDKETGEYFRYASRQILGRNIHGTIEQGIEHLMECDVLVGHNVVSYDIPVIQKLYPWFSIDTSKVRDTLVMGRLIYSHIKDSDTALLKKGKLPGRLFGSHSLEAYGYRLGLMKGEYVDEFKERMGEAYVPGMEWWELSVEMFDYNDQDVVVTDALYDKLVAKSYSEQAIELEHNVAWIMAQQMRNGFEFNEQKAGALYAKLAQRRLELEQELKDFFGSWQVRLPDFIPKRDNKKLGYVAGVPVEKWKTVDFNPASRDHIADRLTNLYGWTPSVFTEGGKPKVDETVLAGLTYPPCKVLTEYLLVAKRISQLAEGDQAWLKLVKKGKIHGSINPNGAVTGRATHAFPNIAQVPSSASPYGHECRELFGIPVGWSNLVGADASGLELRCLAHFMARYDGGEYGNVLLNGDIHTANQQAAGLPTRNNAKTFIYAFLYGAGDEKIGSIVNGDAVQGKKLKKKFLKSLPALGKLVDAVKAASKRGYLVGLDGRQLHVRSSHAALNTLLQSAGALVCKQWLVILERDLQQSGLRHGWNGDYCFCAWVHDEAQIAARTPEIAEVIARLATEAVTKAGEYFNFRCPLAGEAKIGLNWSQTH